MIVINTTDNGFIKTISYTKVTIDFYDIDKQFHSQNDYAIYGRIKKNRIKPLLKNIIREDSPELYNLFLDNQFVIKKISYFEDIRFFTLKQFFQNQNLINLQEVDENGKRKK